MSIRGEKPHPRSIIVPTAVAALIWLMGSAGIAHAHGGMAGPSELGPPLLTSAALGFVCYWLVILWPSSKRKDDAPTSAGSRANKGRRGRRRSAGAPGEMQHLSRVTNVAGKGRS